MSKLSIPCKILDKRRKAGWFGGMKYFVTVELLTQNEHKDSPIKSTSDKVMEIRTGINAYYLMVIGKTWLISFVKNEETGQWSVYRPD